MWKMSAGPGKPVREKEEGLQNLEILSVLENWESP